MLTIAFSIMICWSCCQSGDHCLENWKCQRKILSGKTGQKLFIVSCMFVSVQVQVFSSIQLVICVDYAF